MPISSSETLPAFPFTAVVGQVLLKKALLLAVIDPKLGGVLISGPRGVAKTTLARALNALLPDKSGDFIELPLGCSVAQLTGSLDIDRALAQQEVVFRPGLLAKAHSGILYVDEVNLLPDILVDQLLDAAASGRHSVERDGISHIHRADFVLIGSMNPQEGELRPQLNDRFGLAVQLNPQLSCNERVAIVRARRQYDADPKAFCTQHAHAMANLKSQLIEARKRLPLLQITERLEYVIAERCACAEIEGVRADVAWQRAALAHAALHQRTTVTEEDVNAVESLVLTHRHLPMPPTAPPSSTPTPTFMPPPPFPPSKAPDHINEKSQPLDEMPSPSIAQGHLGEASPSDTSAQPVSHNEHVVLALTPRPKNAFKSKASLQGEAPPLKERRYGQGSFPTDAVDWERSFSLAENLTPNGVKKLLHHTQQPNANDAVLIMLDSSASQKHPNAFAQTRQAVQQLIAQAYQEHRYVALLYFQGNSVKWLLRGKERVRNVTRSLESLQPSGGTPLDLALQEGRRWVKRWQRRFPAAHIDSWLITDGRCTWAPALVWPATLTVVDSETQDRPLGRSRQLATLLGGKWISFTTLAE